MTDAPENIWATLSMAVQLRMPHKNVEGERATEYTRADIAQARNAELEESNAALCVAVAYATQKFTRKGLHIAELEAFASELLDMMDWRGTGTREVAEQEEKEYRDKFATLKERQHERQSNPDAM